MDALQRLDNLAVDLRHSWPRVLRAGGALLVSLSVAHFLLRDWAGTDALLHLARVAGAMLATAAAGLLCAGALREPKGARTFLGLSLLGVPLTGAALGGFTFANPAAFWPLAVAPAAMVAVGWLGFGALARPRRWQLTGMLTLGALLAVIPTRNDGLVLLLMTLGTLGWRLLDSRFTAPALRTFEGRLARGLTLVPLALLGVRSCLYHTPATPFWGAVTALAAALTWDALARLDRWPGARHGMAALTALAAGWMAASTVGLSPWAPLLAGAASAGTLIMLAERHGLRRYVHAAAGLATAGACFAQLAALDDTLIGVAALSVSMAASAWGWSTRHAGPFAAGLGLGALTVVSHAVRVIDLGVLPNWASFAALGAGAIVVASLAERFRGISLWGRFRR